MLTETFLVVEQFGTANHGKPLSTNGQTINGIGSVIDQLHRDVHHNCVAPEPHTRGDGIAGLSDEETPQKYNIGLPPRRTLPQPISPGQEPPRTGAGQRP